MRSITKFVPLSVVTIVFKDSVEHLSFATPTGLPAPGGRPHSRTRAQLRHGEHGGPIATAMGEIYQYTLQGPTDTARQPDAGKRYLADLRTHVQDGGW